ncbi:MAG TPA: Npt1/Npt2 family nucleotide transporter [Vicinamibacteria bacterium]
MASTTLPAPTADERSLLEKLLRPIADVRAGEGAVVLLLALNLFLVLSGYYLLKTIRESLILTESGAAVKTYSSAGQALLLLFLVPAFAAFASRVNRVKLLTWVTLFFVSNIFLFRMFGEGRPGMGIAFFLWVGIFNVMVISQFWAFANDLYTPEQGKRLFAVVGLGSNLGAWMGSLYARNFFKALGPYTLMMVAAGILVACLVVAWVANRLQRRQAPPAKAAEGDEPLGRVGAFELLRKDRYLLLIGLLVIVINVVNTTGEYLLGEMAVKASVEQFGSDPSSLDARQRFVGAFYGDFFNWVNLVGFLAQMLLVSRIMAVVGVGGALFVHPLIALTGYLAAAVSPTLGLVRSLKVLDNATDYSLNNTAKQALWLPTSREAKYKAKQAVDSFFFRAGDVLAAGVVWLGQRLAFSVPVFAAVNAVVALVWLAIAWSLGRENRARMAAAAQGSES